IEDFTAALAQGWFAVGCADRDAGTTYYLIMDGWNETNVPWLEIDYSSGTVLDPPTNLTASVDECDVHLEWDAPGGGGEGQWIYWDQQVNGADGIGLTAGGTFYCASHWNPSDLAPYDGMYMTKMNWYHYDNAATATFILKVWTGANAGTEIMSQTVSSAIGWNEVDLTSPVMIDASQELWFGYEVTHPTGENPAGVDFGPAIYGYGDMISLDGTSWVSMGTEYGLDYNWNLGAYVMDMTDGQGPAQPLVKSTIENPANASFDVASGAPGQYNKFTPNANKALNGYNVYRSGNLLDFTTETMYDDMNVPDGTYNYCVTAVYDEGQSAPVCEEVTVECGNVLDPPTNLTYETDECLVMLDWNAPGGGPTGAILVVDRDGSFDGGYSDDWATIQAALDANGYTYDYYEVTDLTQNGPDLATMVQYDLIIWFSGEAWGYYGDDCMTGTDENNVASFLDGGGALLFSGMDYFYASYPSAGNFTAGQFPYDYLGVTSAVQDNWNVFNPDVASVTGYGAAAGLTFSLQDIYSAKDGLYIDKITHMGDDIFQITSPTPAGMCAVQYDGGSFKSIYTTASLAAITNAGDAAEVIGACVDWLMSTDGKALTGYNVYRDGNLLGFTTATEYTDNSITSSGTYEYCVTAVYDEGESQPICADIAVTCGGTPDCDVFFDDFESYTVGQQLVAQNSTDWTTWSNSPGSTEDPYIVDNGGNVVEITGVNDLVYVMDNYTSGFYTMMFDMYVPTGGDGYFNTLQDFAGTASSWGMQVYFGINNPGEGNLDAGGAMAQMFSFDYDTWMQIKVTVDLDDDWGEFFLNGTLIHGWVWSTGAFGTNSLNQLGGNNFYANPGVNANPLFHFDNYCVDSEGGGNLPPAPENLTGSIVGSDVLLEWEWPAGEGQWIYWDQQVNGADGIGLTAGGTFLCASHWYPADLAPYDGMYINKMNWYHYDNAATATFVLKVWTGANAGTQVMSQSVSSSIGWNEVDLTNPVMIDASTELWFGYEVTHPTGENPAGVDFGPAIYGYGDMISLDGTSWVSMGTEYGLDYNWNLGAYVGGVVEGKTIAQPMVKDIIPAPSNGSFVTSPTNTGVYNKFMPNESKAFDGFNVWHSFNSGSFEPLATGVMDYSYTHVEPEHGLHTYYVTAVVDGLESLPSNEWEVVITGIEDNIFNATQVYPNPATDLVNIRSEYNIEAVTVYNFAGQAISEETVDSKFYQINTSSYNSGVYLFQIRTDEGVISKRIIIE
ncbi:MAG: T9SS type A sorting domain-containing protein, partial [Bacteroidales bacterium]|nr:T9SS type A sorting domain-containing protein [Bacteroidales bacterium]